MTNDQTEVSTHAIFTYLYVSVPNKSKMKLKSVLFHPFEKNIGNHVVVVLSPVMIMMQIERLIGNHRHRQQHMKIKLVCG